MFVVVSAAAATGDIHIARDSPTNRPQPSDQGPTLFSRMANRGRPQIRIESHALRDDRAARQFANLRAPHDQTTNHSRQSPAIELAESAKVAWDKSLLRIEDRNKQIVDGGEIVGQDLAFGQTDHGTHLSAQYWFAFARERFH